MVHTLELPIAESLSLSLYLLRLGIHTYATRWTTDLSPKSTYLHAINFRAVCGSKSIASPLKLQAPRPWGDVDFQVCAACEMRLQACLEDGVPG